MTTIYFIRHAESDRLVRDGRIRPLTEKGLADRKLVTEYLQDKNIDVVLSSPFKRAIDTIADFTEKNGFEIELVEDFREQRSGRDLLHDSSGNPFPDFLERQWNDFYYRFSDGETLNELQERNISALNEVLFKYKNKNIVIGTHAMALSTIINYYDKTYDFEEFLKMNPIMPWVMKMIFDENGCAGMEKIDLFNLGQKSNDGWWKVSTSDCGSLRLPNFYNMDTVKIDVSDITPKQAASTIYSHIYHGNMLLKRDRIFF